jgi:putative methyltransferase
MMSLENCVGAMQAVKSQLQAIVLGAQNNETLIWTVARDCGFLHHVHPDLLEPDNKHLLVVLYEALLGSRRVRGTSKVVELVKNHKSLLQQQLAIHRKAGKAVCHQEKIKLPRFVRVNTIKVSMDEAIKHFELRGWKMSDGKDGGIAGNLLSPPKGRMMKDPQVPNLLVFPAGTSLHNDSLVDVGGVILQDRSSCLSAVALAPVPADAVIADACAAPGNKTSHAASLLKLASERSDWSNSGVIAFERDPKRERMLRRQMQKFGCGEMVNVRGRDFAEAVEEAVAGAKHAEAEQLRAVTHVLVDPSCSGSGLVAQYHGSAGGVSTGEEDAPQHACGAEEHEQAVAGGANSDIRALAREQVKLVLAGTQFY